MKNFPQKTQHFQRENKKKTSFNSRNLENSNKILYSCVTWNQILYLTIPSLYILETYFYFSKLKYLLAFPFHHEHLTNLKEKAISLRTSKKTVAFVVEFLLQIIPLRILFVESPLQMTL